MKNLAKQYLKDLVEVRTILYNLENITFKDFIIAERQLLKKINKFTSETGMTISVPKLKINKVMKLRMIANDE